MAHNAAYGQGHSLVFVAVETEIIGAIELAATLRPEAKAIIDWLKQQDLALYILSGDQDAPTRKLAAELGMSLIIGYFLRRFLCHLRETHRPSSPLFI